ncbi:MAG: VanW family protein [Actinomycetota bacterium]|nr:VanW family protein [Actinomycetota bacterium]
MGAVCAVVVVAGIAVLAGLRLARSGVLPGVHVAEVEVGGLEEARLIVAVEALARRRAGETLTAALGDKTVTVTNGELGYVLDVDATVERALYRGRQGNPLAALADHLRAFGAATEVEPVERPGDDRLDAWVAGAVETLVVPPAEGTLVFDGASVQRVDPRPGARVDREALVQHARAALLRPGDDVVRPVTEPVAPATTPADVDAVLAQARQALSAPVRLSRNDGTFRFVPAEIGQVLEVRHETVDGTVRLRLGVNADRLVDLIPASTVEAFERDPVDARIDVSGGAVTISQSAEGFRFVPEAAAAQLLAIATGPGPREAQLDGEVVAPDLSTQEARSLNIAEPVATFTTHHRCCQSRVANIHRFADLVDGAVVKPGETFSLNRHVGRRTAGKGFVEGGAILRGEYIEDVGGGVSQFATTFFNAAFFGGYDFVEYKPHSYYISRYPVGREATLNYPNVDLVIRNNSPHGILVKTSYTGTSVTVTLWGTKWVDVEAVTGQRVNFRQPRTEVRVNPQLPPGSERVVQQAGDPGFDITVIRVLRFPDGRIERETFLTRYEAQSRIVERGA